MLLNVFFVFSMILQPDSLQKKVENFQKSALMQSSNVVASVWNNTQNKQVVDFNAQKWINPASTLKLLTTATALEILGKDFTFETPIHYSGSILNHELTGDLIIHASGDPTFGSTRWENNDIIATITQAISNKGIKKISGQIRLSSNFSVQDIPDGWIWGDIGNYYGAVPNSFNFAENKFTVHFDGTKPEGKPADVLFLSRKMPGYQLINHVTVGPPNSGDQVMIYSSPLSQTILMKGTIPAGSRNFQVKGSLPNPWHTFTEELKASLKAKLIHVEETENANYSPESELIRHTSPTLFEIIRLCNHESINLFADALLKASFSNKNNYLSFEESISGLRKFWEKKGIKWESFRLEDGSGLSNQNLIQARSYSQFLGKLVDTPYFNVFLETIPQMGISGTVRNLPRSQYPIYVKSGTINGVKTYAGFAKNKQGDWLSFFVGVDKYTPKEAKEVRAFLADFLVSLTRE